MLFGEVALVTGNFAEKQGQPMPADNDLGVVPDLSRHSLT
jgi:hypothetical protein